MFRVILYVVGLYITDLFRSFSSISVFSAVFDLVMKLDEHNVCNVYNIS